VRRAVGAATALLLVLAGLPRPAAAAAQPTFEELLADLKSPNAGTRQDAAEALGKSRRREAVLPLAALVRDPEQKVRLEVVKALRALRDLDAVPALVTSLGDGDPKVREEAIAALVELYGQRDFHGTPVGRFLSLFSDEYDRSSVGPFARVDPSVYQGLAARLKDEDGQIRADAALALGILDGKPALADLVTALQDPDASVRGAATTAIGKLGSGEDGKALIPLLADPSGDVRNRALQALGVLKVREAGPALRELYDTTEQREVKVKVLAALSRVGDPRQADLFRDLAQDPDPDRRRLAVEGLGRIADPSMLPAFKKDYQRETNDEMKLAYAFALTLLGDRAFVDSIVLGLSSRTYGSRCRSYLLEMGSSILPDLYPYLNDPDADIRAALCDVMAAIGDPSAVPHLQPLVSDPSSKVSDRANRAVETLRRGAPEGSGQ
jgi:HEAT repeat protein